MTNIPRLALLSLYRDWRAGELRLIALAIIIAVASLTSVNFFTDRVNQATELQATELLAADLVLQSRLPIPDEIIKRAQSHGLVTARIISLNSMVVAGENLQMAEVKAVDTGYPIRGQLRTTTRLFSEEISGREVPEPGMVWIDSRLYQLLGVEIGDVINVGASEFILERIITYEPDRGGDMFNIAPRLMMNLEDITDTRLILPASRVEYSLLLGGNPDVIDNFRQEIAGTDRISIQGIRDARPELRSALERAEQFLGLAVLVSIALAGLAVAMSAQRYATRHFDNCAIMRCLGTEQKSIATLYLLQLLILSLASSLLGCLLGYLAQGGLTSILAGMTAAELPPASLMPLVTGMAAGVITVLGFAMPQILRLTAVSPLRVLRRDLDPLPAGSVSSYAAAILTLVLLTPWQSGNTALTAYSLLGIIMTAILLTTGAMLLIRFLNRLRTRVGVASRFGLANVARRANLSIAQILAIGLGVMVMILLTLIRTDLLDNWRNRLPEGTPNYFLINIQEEDVDRIQTFLEQDNRTTATIYPMIRARLTEINGQEVDPDSYSDEEKRRWTRREYNLTWSEGLPAANQLIEGDWWPAGSDEPMFSLEEEIMDRLGVSLNDTMTFLIAGREVTGRIASVRRIDWDSFNVNFFIVASPGTLEGYPASYVTSFFLPAENRDLIIDLVKTFPSVTVFDVDALITEVRRIMNQVILAVEFIFGFTLLAGIIVLIAALQTTHDERSYETALLSALGASRRQILSSLTTEFLCLGLIAGILSALSASIVEAVLARFVFNMDITFNYWTWLLAPLICTAVIVLGGLAGTRRTLYTPPVVVLRQN
ncbi:MAG: FtsX-like permease family protein [Gammaproteobacteria bacterium]